jgi:phosphate transport system protein
VNIAKLIPHLGQTRPPRDDRAGGDDRGDGRTGPLGGPPVQAGVRAARRWIAEDLVRQDARINRLNRDAFKLAVQIGTDEDTREWAMHMMLVARALERLGDNAVDIGEQVAFVVTGLFREFSDASHQPSEGFGSSQGAG